MKVNMNTIDQLYQLDNIVRYSTFTKHKSETVATHSFYVALFTMMLCEELELSNVIKLKAMEVALVHDVPEILINDVTYTAKQVMPEIVPILEKHEQKFINHNFPNQEPAMYGFDDTSQIIQNVVKLADVISVLQFSANEQALGNIHVAGWVDDAKHRILEITKSLERLGVSCQRITI